MRHKFTSLRITDRPDGPGLEATAEVSGGSLIVAHSRSLTLWELREKLRAIYPGAAIVFDPDLVPDPDYTGRAA